MRDCNMKFRTTCRVILYILGVFKKHRISSRLKRYGTVLTFHPIIDCDRALYLSAPIATAGHFNSFLASSDFCCLLITFLPNSLDPDQDQLNVGPDLDPNCLTLRL